MWRVVRAFMGGFAAALLIVAAGAGYIVHTGVVAHVDAAALTADVQGQVRQQVAAELPNVIDRVKQEVPAKVAAQVDAELGSTSFTLYGVQVTLPASATAGLRAHLRDEITGEFQQQLDDIDVGGMADQWAADAATALNRTLRSELAAHPFEVQILPGIDIPVHVVAD